MSEYPVLITVRTSSSRLPKKCLLDFGKISVISYVIKRAKENNLTPILTTTKNKSDDILCEIAKKHKIKFYRGSEKNKLKRWYDAAKKFKLNFFHTVDADDPFFCEQQVKKSIKLLQKDKLDVVYPSYVSSKGEASEGYSINVDFLKNKLKKISNHNIDTEMINSFIKNGNKKYLSNSKYITKSRLTLDYFEDYIFLLTIKLILKKNITRKKIYFLLKKNKHLKKINFFRNKQWQIRQKLKSK